MVWDVTFLPCILWPNPHEVQPLTFLARESGILLCIIQRPRQLVCGTLGVLSCPRGRVAGRGPDASPRYVCGGRRSLIACATKTRTQAARIKPSAPTASCSAVSARWREVTYCAAVSAVGIMGGVAPPPRTCPNPRRTFVRL